MFNFDLMSPHDDFLDLLAHTPLHEVAKADLQNRFLQAGRLYHTHRHFVTMWTLHQALYDKRNRKIDCLIASAILFHDAVYDPALNDNEKHSAELWLAADCYRDARDIDWVCAAILATANHLERRNVNPDSLLEWFVGLDLAALGAPWDRFRLHNKLIRLEYSHLSDAEWAAGNGGFLRNLLAQPVIYRHPLLRQHFEASARANLERHLAGSSLFPDQQKQHGDA